MKKSLIALAVLGVVSGAAMAQSSVTLYGIADAALVKQGGQRAQMGSGTGSGINSANMTNQDSRLGVLGTEDIGGGLKAGFQFETRLSLENGNSIAKNNSNGLWSPAAFVWVGGDSWGTFKMGRSLTPSFFGVAAWELTGQANYSLVGKTYNYAGQNARNDSEFSYKTPNIAGVTAEVAFITKADVQNWLSTTGAANSAYGAKWDANVIYNGPASLPLSAGLSVNKTKTYAGAPIDAGKTNWVLGAKYNFGSFIVAASYEDTHNNPIAYWAKDGAPATTTSGVYGHRAGVTVGGTALLGPFSLTADIARDTKVEDTGSINGSNPNKKRTNFLLEGKYNLSKRTSVYLAGLRFEGTNNYGLGLQHKF